MTACVPRRPAVLGRLTTSALVPQTKSVLLQTQTRNADILRRPRVPYSFSQLIQLSDGSTYTVRTMSPMGMYKSQKDTRNHIMWNPSETSLQNVEVDEAGRLALFRERYGRNFDADKPVKGKGANAAPDPSAADGDSLADLMTQYAQPVEEDKKMGGKINNKSR